MAPKKGFTGKDAFARMNFLYQASALCSSFSSKNSEKVAAYYGSVFKNVAKKAVVRAEPEIKRSLCKGCSALLVPGNNVRISLKKKPAPRLVWTCLCCSTIKRFGVRKDYKIWLDCDEAVVEKATYGNTVSMKQEDKPEEMRNNECGVLFEDSVEETKTICRTLVTSEDKDEVYNSGV